MKEQEQRIAIAEALGWRPHPDNDSMRVKHWTLGGDAYGGSAVKHASSEIVNDDTWGWKQSLLPDYLNDLNAMHEAEKEIADNTRYWTTLTVLIRDDLNIVPHKSIHPSNFTTFATAAQRAEAFLKTLNLWKTS